MARLYDLIIPFVPKFHESLNHSAENFLYPGFPCLTRKWRKVLWKVFHWLLRLWARDITWLWHTEGSNKSLEKCQVTVVAWKVSVRLRLRNWDHESQITSVFPNKKDLEASSHLWQLLQMSGWHPGALLTRLWAALRELALHPNFPAGSLGPTFFIHYLWSATFYFFFPKGLSCCIAISSGKTMWALLCCTAGEMCFPSRPLHKARRSKQLWAPRCDWLANYQLQFHALFLSI